MIWFYAIGTFIMFGILVFCIFRGNPKFKKELKKVKRSIL